MVVHAANGRRHVRRELRSCKLANLAFVLLWTWVAWSWSCDLAYAQDECGDVNGDGNVTTVDALTILQAAVGVQVTLSCPGAASLAAPTVVAGEDGCGDVNGDGNISPSDALLVLSRSVGFDVEFACPPGTAARNRVRYLNGLICEGEEFNSVLRLPSENLRWESFSGVHSPYQDYDKPQLGGGWTVTLGDCGSTNFSDLVNLPADSLILIRLELDDFLGFVEISFYNEGPMALHAGDAGPFAVMRLPAPAGIGVAP
jgi:hypothetical protein